MADPDISSTEDIDDPSGSCGKILNPPFLDVLAEELDAGQRYAEMFAQEMGR
jgi:hypothetical protein